MKLNKIFLPLLFATFTHVTVHAATDGGLFVEPMVTYEDGDTETEFPAPFGSTDGESNGWGVGARLGFHVMESFFLAADGRYHVTDFKDDGLDYNEKATGGNLGATVGFQMPDFGLRVWGTYIATGELNPEESGSTDLRFTDATGYRVGAGFHLEAISLNLEYQDLKYSKTTVEDGGGIFPPGSTYDDVELKNKSWIVGISFPLEL